MLGRIRGMTVGALLWIAASAPALANYSCVGTVDGVSVAPGTGVVIFSSSVGLASVYLCQIENTVTTPAGSVTPEECKTFLGVLLVAQATRQSVELDFNDSLTCTTHPSWAWLTGWYFGPALHAGS